MRADISFASNYYMFCFPLKRLALFQDSGGSATKYPLDVQMFKVLHRNKFTFRHIPEIIVTTQSFVFLNCHFGYELVRATNKFVEGGLLQRRKQADHLIYFYNIRGIGIMVDDTLADKSTEDNYLAMKHMRNILVIFILLVGISIAVVILESLICNVRLS